MERSTTNLSFLDIMINKTGIKIWMDRYNKPTASKRYVPFTSKHPEVTSEIFHFVWLDASVLLLKKKT